MRVPRSATIALAALFAGALVPARAESTRAEPGSALRTAAVEPDAAPTASVSGGTESAKPTTPDEAVGVPAESVPKAGTPAAPASGSAEAPTAAPAVPSDPQAAALFNRLADTAPLLARLTAKEREAIRAFYALGAFKPVWIADGAYNPAAKAAAARLAAAGEDGLDARAYPVPRSPDSSTEAAAIADADLKLSAAIALYARDARGGRVNLASISRLITPSLDLPAADTVLAAVAGAGAEAGAVLQRYNPRQPGYLALKARLAALRGPAQPSKSGPDKPLKLPPGPMLKLGMRDPRVPLLRQHLGIEARAPGTLDHGPGEPDAYDAGVAKAVSAFQRARGLAATGNLNAQTVLALAGAQSPRQASGDEAALIVNMERWRWLPAELGSDYVLVNVPEYRLRVFRQGRLRDETRVIVGKTESPTPLFSGMMEYAVVNPSWYVPPSILKTMLPKIAAYGGKTWGGYEVVRRGGHVSLRQPPGEKNALGFIKFMFPNNHAVYLHDTPNRSLFARSDRALSHGCVRVDDPFRFADAVLSEAWTSERLKKLIGKGERTIRLDEKLPVHLAYFTAEVDDLGSYRTLPDIYGYDAPMRAALGLPGGGGPAIARGPKAPAESPRRAAEMPRPKPKVRQAARPSVRVEAAPVYADPDPWAPRPAPVTRGWW
ncbi:L,D-transpeptidase family protein [Methylobacterium radiodurans]|uniref:Murein L,D-transpeptidase n=1 Tax=Methylobacterium radiodurans TaxID=2202828 RepID=A0A2U8VZS2_9HYPH|nr:L,D-transpeptidase family protein [Methylobacterium radiodurans]AWN38968.1 murein L,D-transpeptidase [Methylobacterium radiodurans]